MIDKWTTIDVVDSEVRQRLKTYNEQGRIDPDDVIQNTRKALRAIGTNEVWDDKWACVRVRKHTGRLPDDIYKVILSYKLLDTSVLSTSNLFKITSNTSTSTSVSTDTCAPSTTTTTTTETIVTQEDCGDTDILTNIVTKVSLTDIMQVIDVSVPMYYGGSDLELLYDSNSNVFMSNMTSYIIRGQRVITSFQDGTMLVNYLGEARDDLGIPLIPDDEDVINALVAFNIFRILEEDFYNRVEGITPLYAEAKTNWENFRAMAQNNLKLITIPEAFSKVVDNSSRYWQFRLKDTYPFKYYN